MTATNRASGETARVIPVRSRVNGTRIVDLVVASHNQAKLAMIAELIGDLALVRAASAAALGDAPENAASLAANAEAKACRVSRREPAALVVATDGGLLLPALGDGWDPLQTRRFAGPQATDRERTERLLALMEPYHGAEREIAWQEAMAVARAGEIIASWTAASPPGRLAAELNDRTTQYASGFWLPPLWVCPEWGNRRLADLTPVERGRHDDHWRRLGRRLRRLVSDDASGDVPNR